MATRARHRALAGAVAALTLLGPAAASASSGVASTARRLAITAFQEVGDPNALITRSEKAITTVGVDGVDVTRDGSAVSPPGSGALAALAVAHRDGLRAEFLVSNWDDRINDFSPAIAQRLLTNAGNVSQVATQLADDVQRQGWDGVSVDLESLDAADATGLVDLLSALRASLPAGKSISVCISNSLTAAAYRERGYDLAGIAGTGARVILMAYDQHGTWENQPGPVGALAWQRRGLAALRARVPAAQVDLGQAGYGYAWRPHRNVQISDARARQIVAANHGSARFDAAAGEWTASLPDGSTLWWADARSFALRVKLALRQHLHGLAVWDLGESDPLSL
ncbi:MAG TPA: glycosyl hydrolase family 18 protein [Mycobacteriales bacterium]|nr:glycosyl hydrolase family 18 protein [Mycobacteriales bacterium]